MGEPIRVLIVEDSEDDTLLLLRHLSKGDYDPVHERVDTTETMRDALTCQQWDIVISDYRMPHFDGLEALSLFQHFDLDIPFIIVSGTIGEDVAVKAMRAGAHDYIMKDNLTRLLPAIQREMKETQVRQARKQAEQEFRKSEHRYRTLFESAPESIALVGLDGTVIDCNTATGILAGRPVERIIGQKFPDLGFLPKEVVPDYLTLFSQLLAGEVISPIEVEIRNQDGELRWLDVHLASLWQDDELWAIQVISRDITQRKQIEESLIQTNDTLQALIDNSPLAIVMTDREGKVSLWNAAAEKLYGWVSDEVIGKFLPNVSNEKLEEHQTIRDRINSGETITSLEVRRQRKDGSTFPLNLSIAPLRNSEGDVYAQMSIGMDITERKQAEQALRLTQLTIDLAPDSVEWISPEGQIIYVNDKACRSLGYLREELLDMAVWDIDPNITPDMNEKRWRDLKAEGTLRFETLHKTKDGRVFPVEVSSNYIVFGDKELGSAYVRDITKRKQMEEGMRRYAERLSILHNIDQEILAARSAEDIARVALQHVHALMSYRAASIILLDAEAQEMILFIAEFDGIDNVQFGARMPLQTFESIEQVLTLLEQGDFVLVDDVPELTRMRSELSGLSFAEIGALLNVPLIFKEELIGFISIEGESYETFGEEQIEIIREMAVQLAIAIHQARLHEQVEQHAVELEARVMERTADLRVANQRLEALSRVKDEFVSNVSHELRTPITSVKLYLHLLEAHHDLDPRYINALNRETARLEKLIEGLLTLSRLDQKGEQFNPVPIDLNELIKEFIADREVLAKEKEISLDLNLSLDIIVVQADRNLLAQTFSILLTNALAYTPADGRVTVQTLRRKTEDQLWAGFSISDTGPGVSADEKEHLFDRFFRGSAGHKSNIPGTGLGLSIAKEIIERHQGEIDVYSEGAEGQGTTFTVWLPSGPATIKPD